MKGRTGVTVPFQPPQSTSAEPRGDVLEVKRTLPVAQKKARHKEELLFSWLTVSCLCCSWDCDPTGSFRHTTGHFTLMSVSFIALCSSVLLGKSWSRQTLALSLAHPRAPRILWLATGSLCPGALSWRALPLPSQPHRHLPCPSSPMGLHQARAPTLAKLKEMQQRKQVLCPLRGFLCNLSVYQLVLAQRHPAGTFTQQNSRQA